MAKIKCAECGIKNPFGLDKCTQCGSNLTAPKMKAFERYRLLYYSVIVLGLMLVVGALTTLFWGSLGGTSEFILYESLFSFGFILFAAGVVFLVSPKPTRGDVIRIGLLAGAPGAAFILLLGIILWVSHYRVLFTVSLIYVLFSLGCGQIIAFYLLKNPFFHGIGLKNIAREVAGSWVIAEREFLSTLFSIRMVTIAGIFGISIFAYAYYLAVDPGIIDPVGPDDVIADIGTQLICTMGPLFAVALSFDTITRERNVGSLTFLLSRPLSKRSVALGKFAGVIGALVLPVVILTILVVPFIAWIMGSYPSPQMVYGFVVFSVVLIGVFALFQLILSTIAKTSATAILTGVGLWIFFNFFWAIVLILVYLITGEETPSGSLGILSILYVVFESELGWRISLFNPGGLFGGAYNMNLEQLRGTEILGLSESAPLLALILWFIVVFIAAIEIFNRKASD
ncbi:MAG: ABC transporter permease subunit [Thermoplasmata archaeon]|nr:MAG: ABC transporter permease subunit [Thermoplasmata archaeon]